MVMATRGNRAAERNGDGQGAGAVSGDSFLFFAAVAEDLSFTKAARRLEIDQSWLSHKIRQLEAELSCTLFTRSTRHVELTDAGTLLLGPSLALARATAEARRTASALRAGLRGTLRIGALPYSFVNPDRVSLIDRFITEHPETDVVIVNGSSRHLAEQLRNGELDVAFISWPFETDGLAMLRVRRDHFLMALPHGHPLEAMPVLPMAALAGHRMVMPSPEHNRLTFESLFQPFVDAGIEAVTIPEFQSDALFRYARGNGVMVLCKEVEARRYEEGGFTLRAFADHEAVNEKYLVRLKGGSTPGSNLFWGMAAKLS